MMHKECLSITKVQMEAIQNFMLSVDKLRKSGVIKSDRYLGDIGEFLTASSFNLTLAKSLRQAGHDTEGEKDRVQIKFHNSPTRTNIDLGKPDKYDRVIVLIGTESRLHPGGEYAGKYCFYEFSANDVKINCSTKKSYSCGKLKLGKPVKTLDLQNNT